LGVITTFKAYYLRKIFDMLVKENDKITVKDIWRAFFVRDVMPIIADA
jgi:hypothetical protein